MRYALLIFLLALPVVAYSQVSPARVEVTPSTLTIQAGETIQATVKAYDANNNEIPLPPHQWFPTDQTASIFPTCVSVSQTGLIKGEAVGQCGATVVVYNSIGSLTLPTNPISITVLPSPLLHVTPSGRVIALQSNLFTIEPFNLTSPINLGPDKRTRVSVFMSRVEANQTVTAEFTQGTNTRLGAVEYSGPVPNIPDLYQVVIRLPDGMPTGDHALTVIWKGVRSNTGMVEVR